MNFEERNRIVRSAIDDDDLVTIERVHPNAFVLNQQLFRAIEAGNLRDVQTAVEAGADVNLEKLTEDALLNPDLPATIQNLRQNFYDYFVYYNLPLIAAMRNGNFEIAKYLLENGASDSYFDERQGTVLQVAIDYNHDYGFNKKMIRYLLENPARHDPNLWESYLDLSEIIANNRLDVMEFLLQNWPLGNFANDYFRELLSGTRGNPSKEMVQLFINNGADVNLRGNSPYDHDLPLLVVFRRGDIEIFKLLLENGAEVNESFITDFQTEVQRTSESIVRGHSYADDDQQFFDTLPEFKRIIFSYARDQKFFDTLPEFKRTIEQARRSYAKYLLKHPIIVPNKALENIQKASHREMVRLMRQNARLESELDEAVRQGNHTKAKRLRRQVAGTSQIYLPPGVQDKITSYLFQDLKSLTVSQLRRVYQKVYGKKCPVKSKKAILKILQRK